MKKFLKLVGYDESKQTTVKTELLAGLVTFLAMCYILTVNPNQFFYAGTADVRWSSVFIATALGAVVGTLLMAFLAKMPLAQASGMGLNSLMGSIIGGGIGAFAYGFEFTLGQGLMMVLISGLVFTALTLINFNGKSIRELIFDGMPKSVRTAISVGIGLFIAYIGFQNAGLIVVNGYTQVALIDFTNKGQQVVNLGTGVSEEAILAGNPFASPVTTNVNYAFVCLFGLGLIAMLDHFNVKGSVIIGILGATLLGIPLKVTNLEIVTGSVDGISWKFWENIGKYFKVGEESAFGSFATVFKTGFPAGSAFTVVMLIITMCMIDMFDTMGTIVGCCGGNRILSDENDKPYNYGRIMMSDAVGTLAGSLLGTSTVTTFVESGAGVAAGGRTGLTALTTAVLFFLSIFILPVFAMIPSAASASALIYVGVLMMKNNAKNIDFSNAIGAVSAFLTVIIMCVAYSITKGIGVGMVVYTLLSLIAYVVNVIVAACKKTEMPKFDVSIVSIIVTALFLVYFLVPTVL